MFSRKVNPFLFVFRQDGHHPGRWGPLYPPPGVRSQGDQGDQGDEIQGKATATLTLPHVSKTTQNETHKKKRENA